MKRLEGLKFDRPYLLLCEGESDKKLFDRLISRCVPGDLWQVVFVRGRSHFADELIAYEASPTFVKNVEAVVIMSDKDDDPAASFAEVQTEIAKTSFPVPQHPEVFVRKAGLPALVTWMVPIRESGNIETLCLLSARDNWQLDEPINQLIEQTPARDWGLSKLSKAKMEIYLAVRCRQKPEVSFAGHWHLSEEYHLPLTHYCFDEYAAFFRNFPELLERSLAANDRGGPRAQRA